MKNELLCIHNGVCRHCAFEVYDLYLEIMEGSFESILCSSWGEKERLLQLLSGTYGFDGGEIIFHFQKINCAWKPRAYLPQDKITIISGKSTLIASIGIVDNLMISKMLKGKMFLSDKKLTYWVRKWLKQFHIDIDLDLPVNRLTKLKNMQIELLRAYIEKRELVLLDDIGRLLLDEEIAELMKLIARLQDEGMTFLWLTMGDRKVLLKTERMHVFHHGRILWVFEHGTLDSDGMFQLINRFVHSDEHMIEIPPVEKEIVFSCRIEAGNYLRDIAFYIYRGELIQIIYSQREESEELIQNIQGKLHAKFGNMKLLGKEYAPAGVEEAIKKGVAVVSPDEMETQLCFGLSVYDNVCLARAGKVQGIWMNKKYRHILEDQILHDIGVESGEIIRNTMQTYILNGILYEKWLLYAPDVIVVNNPFPAIDQPSFDITKKMLKRFMQRGTAVILFDSTQAELTEIPKTRLHLRQGRLIRDK